jgi:LEA14-like dessication related protein
MRGQLRAAATAVRGRVRAAAALFRALGLAAGCAFLAGCASLGLGGEPLDVNVVNLTPLPSTAFEHRLRVDLRLRNPNDRSYEIDGLRFALDVNGSRLATGVSSETATLPRLGEVVIPVTTTTTLVDLVNQIVAFDRMAAQERPRFEFELRGRVFLANSWGGIDFERTGSQDEFTSP